MRTIRVTGKGAVSVRPDMTRLDIRVAGVCPEYSKALERSTQDAEALRAAFGAIGFQKTDLKTTGFGVRAQAAGTEAHMIDYEALRSKLRDECFAAFYGGGIGTALMDALDVDGMEPEELVRTAKQWGIDVGRFEMQARGLPALPGRGPGCGAASGPNVNLRSVI